MALAPDDAVDGVRAEALCDLARLYYKEGRRATAREHLCECRTIAKTGGSLALIQADLLDGELTADDVTSPRLKHSMRVPTTRHSLPGDYSKSPARATA